MLRWRNWRPKYVSVQDRALKLCPAWSLLFAAIEKTNVLKCTDLKSSVQEKKADLYVEKKKRNVKW